MTEPWTREWKEAQLEVLKGAWKDCRRCFLSKRRHNVVFGHGDPDADIIFISEAPGETEDETGIPFEGRAGELLNSLLSAAGIKRSSLFITNIVGCRPPNNREPIKDEKIACAQRLFRTIYIVDPLLVVAVGKVAFETLVKGRSWSIEKERGRMFSDPAPEIRIAGERNGAEIPGVMFPRKNGTLTWPLTYDVVPIYHPAYILRFDNYIEKEERYEVGGYAYQTVDDLKEILARVKRLKKEHEMTRRLLRR